MRQMVDAEIEGAGRKDDPHESADRKNEEKHSDRAEHHSLVGRTHLSGFGVLDPVHPVDRREQQSLDAAFEIEWRSHVSERAGDRAAGGVVLVLTRWDEKGRDPNEDEHKRQNGHGRRKSALAHFGVRLRWRRLSGFDHRPVPASDFGFGAESTRTPPALAQDETFHTGRSIC